jgi:transposase
MRDGVAGAVAVIHRYSIHLAVFRRTAATLRRWQQEVPSYWRYPLANALVEDKHDRIRVLVLTGTGPADRI